MSERRAITLRSRLEELPRLSAFARQVLEGTAFDESARHHVELCLIEAVTNAIRHAYPESEEETIEVRALRTRGELELEVSDFGIACPSGLHEGAESGARRLRSAEGAEGAEVEEAAGALREGGRGLFLIHALMDEVRLEQRGDANVLVMVKRSG